MVYFCSKLLNKTIKTLEIFLIKILFPTCLLHYSIKFILVGLNNPTFMFLGYLIIKLLFTAETDKDLS